MRSLVVFIITALLSASACAQTKVGGPCIYEEFPGLCTVTSVEPDGGAHFTYEGEIDGEAALLRDNATDHDYSEGDVVDCDLGFITEGTCTPCVVSIGSCGEEAWAAFTAWAARRSASGCSLSARSKVKGQR